MSMVPPEKLPARLLSNIPVANPTSPLLHAALGLSVILQSICITAAPACSVPLAKKGHGESIFSLRNGWSELGKATSHNRITTSKTVLAAHPVLFLLKIRSTEGRKREVGAKLENTENICCWSLLAGRPAKVC